MTTAKMISVDREPTEDEVSNNKHKRKSHDDPVPNLIDEKRRHLEKGLPARQRDQLLFREVKEDSDPHFFLFFVFSFSIALIFAIGCLTLLFGCLAFVSTTLSTALFLHPNS